MWQYMFTISEYSFFLVPAGIDLKRAPSKSKPVDLEPASDNLKTWTESNSSFNMPMDIPSGLAATNTMTDSTTAGNDVEFSHGYMSKFSSELFLSNIY
jgi:hypothetical protein